jgi:hypothetical protein
MRKDLDFAYAQARIQARFATLPQETEWERLAASRTLAAFLEEARTGSLCNWVKGFSSQSDIHDLEAGIRSLYWDSLEAVAGWVPAPWREAVSWVRWLAWLPLLSHLKSGGVMPDWTAQDQSLHALADSDGALSMQRLEEAGAACLLHAEEDVVSVWIAEWKQRWPRCSRTLCRDLEALIPLVMTHFDVFPRLPPDSAWRQRRELRATLRLHFHRQPLEPAIPFVYLALTALDLERLRAALVSRALFPVQDEPARHETAERFAA